MARAGRNGKSKWSERAPSELDGRLLEAAEEQRLIAELTEYVGGNPPLPQRLLIKRIVRATIIVGILERKVIESGDLGDLQSRQMNAMWNTIARGLTALSVNGASDRPRSLRSYVGKDVGKVA